MADSEKAARSSEGLELEQSSASESGELSSFLRRAAHISRRRSLVDEPDRSGQRVEHFLLSERIGQGGMGVVYAATDVRLGRDVALKLLPARVVGDPAERRRLLNEARAAAAVGHPNIAVVYDVGESTEGVFIAMERVRGATLRSLLANGGLSRDQATSIVRQVAAGIGAAHRRGVVHRDLKPENVMVSDSLAVKVLDFGLAVLPEAEEAEEEVGVASDGPADGRVIGTPSYMSPEQARGETVTPASDVFSLGTMFFEMLGGRRPFGGDTVTQVLRAVREQAPPRLQRVPRGLERLVRRCLSKDPGERPSDGDALLAELDALTRRERLNRRALVAMLAALSVAAIVSVYAAQGSALHAASTVAPLETIRLTPQLAPPGVAAPRDLASASPAPPSSASPVPARPLARRANTASRSAAPTASTRAIDPLARQK